MKRLSLWCLAVVMLLGVGCTKVQKIYVQQPPVSYEPCLADPTGGRCYHGPIWPASTDLSTTTTTLPDTTTTSMVFDYGPPHGGEECATARLSHKPGNSWSWDPVDHCWF
jgi:hypothetical protein